MSFRSVRLSAWIGISYIALLYSSPAAAAPEQISHGRFKNVTMYQPRGAVRQFVLMLSGDAGWTPAMAQMAGALSEEGALVAGIDVPQLFANFEQDDAECVYPDGDLENLSHSIQAYYRLPTYHTPLLVGYSAGATLAYAMVAQAPQGTFAGALSLGFCPDLELHKRLCKTGNLRYTVRKDGRGFDLQPARQLAVPWIALHGELDQVCGAAAAQSFVTSVPKAQFVLLKNVGHGYAAAGNWQQQYKSAYAKLGAADTSTLPPPPKDLSGLPMVEVPAKGTGDMFAIILSGDGGWAGLDKEVAAALAKSGVPVAGLDSLRYFWSKRTPEGLATDLDRIIRYYAAHWNRKKVVLIGYSQGADVLPFAITRLPAATRKTIALSALLGLEDNAQFEFHFSNWLKPSSNGLPIAPEMAKLDATTLCIYGEGEKDSLCPKLSPGRTRVVKLPGGHHFDGNYRRLAKIILDAAQQPAGR
jgi:type IV secretory pathway VirJ component